jgi:acyl carrier protein
MNNKEILEEIRSLFTTKSRLVYGVLGNNERVKDFGIDSLDLLEAIFILEEKFDIDLNLNKIGFNPTVKEIAEHIVEALGEKHDEAV